MDAAIGYQIETLISRGASILNGLEAELQQLRAPGVHIASDLIAESAGEFAAELFRTHKARGYGKKATKAWLDGQRREAAKAITGRYYQRYKAWFQDILQFVSGISINTPRVVFPGNSQVLLRKLRRAEGFKKLETRIRHVVTKLEELRTQDLILNTSLPKQLTTPQEKRGKFDPVQALHKLEDTLRRFIERELSNSGSGWWLERIPPDIRSRTEGRMRKQESVWPWHPVSSTNVMDYLDFSDYRKIILLVDNWNQCFRQVFTTTSFIETRLGELEPIRHDIAHSRPLSPVTTDKLRLFSEEIQACLKRGR